MDFQNFDKLYSKTCDDLRKSQKTDEVLWSLKTASSDWERVQIIIQQNPDAIKLFKNNIIDRFDPKNVIKANNIFETACSNKSFELVNQALCLHPFKNDFKLLLKIRDIQNLSILKIFLDHELPTSKTSCNSTFGSGISEIFHERSKISYEAGYYEACIIDIIRSVDFGHEKTYEMTFRAAVSYKKLGFLDEAKLVFQNALQLLRLSPLDNEFKSKETISLVSLLKEIKQLEQSKKMSVENNAMDKELLILDHLNVYGEPNPILIGCSNAIKLRFSEERGRHVVAIRTIPPGSTLIVERPYAWSVSPTQYRSHCLFCMQSTINGIPCPTCSSVMFCSESCFQRAIETLNPNECKILKLLDSSEKLGSMALLCFRTISQTSLETVKKEFQKSREVNPPLETILGYDQDGKLDSSNYSSVFAQTTNSVSRHAGDLLKRTYAAIYLTICLKYIGYFGDENLNAQEESKVLDFSEDEQIVSAVLLRHLQSASCNAYGVNYVSNSDLDRTKPLEINEIGGATYPIISTTNHSCSQNAYRFNIGKICVVKTLREISEGDEILDSYGPLHTISSLEQRVEELENQYLFRCTCEACTDNWPTFAELRSPAYQNVYKCPNCHIGKLEGQTGSGNGSKDNNKRKCLGCGKVMDFKKVQKLLKAAEDKYLRAKEAVLHQNNNNLDTEKSICNYILTIQKVVLTPCKQIVEAQEILKLHWNLWVRSGRFRSC